MQKHFRRPVAVAILSFVFFAIVGATPVLSEESLSPGLTDADPMVRLIAVQEVGRKNIRAAEEKVAKMAKDDPFAGVREAACSALQDLKATWQVDLLADIAANDPDPAVRNAAATAVSTLRRELARDTALNPTPNDEEYYRRPVLLSADEPEPDSRVLGVGVGIMGGYGLAAVSLRGKIPTGIKYLPWIGIEAGAGWTPPSLYVVTAGPVDSINSDDKWQIISGGGAVLLYPHRMHYAAFRGGFDIGRGGYAIVGYGFEMLNEEGFFSWGVEAGILIQPAIDDRIDRLTTCDEKGGCDAETWPVIPFVRFALHFYPI